MVDRRGALSLISSWDHYQRFSPSQISDTPRTGFEPAQNLGTAFVEWNCSVVITTTQFVIFNPRKLLWNWIAFYQNSVVISPGLFITWLEATMDDLQTRPLRQILLFLWNNSLTVWKLQTVQHGANIKIRRISRDNLPQLKCFACDQNLEHTR